MTNVTLTVSNNIKISGQLPEQTEATIKNRLVVENPAYKSALDWGRDLYGIPKELIFFEYVDHDLCVPRGFGSGLASILNQHNVEFKIVDNTKKRKNIEYRFVGTPYDYQADAVRVMLQKNIGVLQAPTGCHAKNTKILMANGTLKNVQSVIVGDEIMGDDSKPRKVLSLFRGRGDMYKISPIKGESFVVNSSHVLSLVHSQKGTIENLTVSKYINQTSNFKHLHKLYRVPVKTFCRKSQHLILEPYFLGVYLGDGCSANGSVKIWTMEPEIKEYCKGVAFNFGLKYSESKQENNKSVGVGFSGEIKGKYHKNIIIMELEKLGLHRKKSADKFVPESYKLSSFKNRLSLLAGLLDTDGSLYRNTFDFISKSKQLALDTTFIARSVGLAACMKPCIKGYGDTFKSKYYRVTISGHTDIIPNIVMRRKAGKRLQIKNALRTGFNVETIGNSEYFGFNVDGNNLYCMGDFTVTHNSGKTVMALKIIAHRGQRALIVVHNKELLYQWQERIFDFLGIPLERVGLIGDGNKFNKSLDIHVGIVNSVSKVIEKINGYIGMLIIDECHRVPSTTFAKVASKVDCKYMLGLSATPFRRDKLTRLIWLYLGDRRHEIGVQGLQEDKHIIKPKLIVKHTTYSFDYFDNYVEMAGDIGQNEERNRLIVETAKEFLLTGQGMALVVSDRKQHCEALYRALSSLNVNCRLMTGATRADVRRAIVDEINQGSVDILIATTQLIGEGFDAKGISAVILGMPIGYEGRLLQVIGRTVRTAEGKESATVYDFVDVNVGVLVASFRKRIGVYQSLGIKFEGSV